MRIKYLFLLILVALLGCTSESLLTPEQTENNDDKIGNLPSGAIEGIVYIKIKEQAHKALSIKASTDGVSTCISEFDQLSRAYKVSTMEPVFNVTGRFEVRKRKAGLHLWYRVEFDKQTPLKAALSGFLGLEMIDIAEPEIKVVSIGDPNKTTYLTESISAQMSVNRASQSQKPFNDPELVQQWHYNNDGTMINSNIGADINLFKAWGVTTGSPEVIVAVIDGGVDFNHKDLKANMWTNTDKSESNPHKNGVHGWNFLYDSERIVPDSHGTHVAGTVAAVNNNDFGGCGVAGGDGTPGSGVRIMTVQIGLGVTWSDNDGVAKAFEYATDNGAVITQNSWGFEEEVITPAIIRVAIDYFIDNAGTDENGVQSGPMKGGLAVFSAGNFAKTGNTPLAPASYPRVISVGSMAPDYRLAQYSQYGTWVSIVAPGGATLLDEFTQILYLPFNGVYSTVPNNEMDFKQGTSMAAPHVSGVAALAISHFGVGKSGFTANNLKAKLMKGANRIDNINHPKFSNKMGVGLIDAHMVLTGVAPVRPNPSPVTDLKCDWSKYSHLALEWSVTADATYKKAFAYDILLSEREITEADFKTRPNEMICETVRTEDRKLGSKISATVKELKAGVHYYVAIKAVSFDHGTSTTARQEGVTIIGHAPEPVTDLTVEWMRSSVILSWKITRDVDTNTPDRYEILLSKNNLIGVDFENPPADVVKHVVPVEYHAVGATLYQRIESLDEGTKYYVSIQSVDIENQRSEAMMIIGNTKGDAPVVTNPTMTEIVLVGLNKSTTIDLKEYFYDQAGAEKLTYTLEATPSDIAKLTIGATGVVTILSQKYGTATVKVKATNTRGFSVEHPTGFKVECKTTGGITPPAEKEVDIYPNPVVDIMNIAMKSTQTVAVALYNSMGSRVLSQSVSVEPGRDGKVDLSRISGGVYTVVMKYGGQEVKQRITKL